MNSASLNLGQLVTNLGDGIVHVGGQSQLLQGISQHAIPTNNSELLLRGLPGSNVNTGYVLQVPQAGATDLMEFPGPQTFRIQNRANNADVTFEVDTGFGFDVPLSAGRNFTERPQPSTFVISNNGVPVTFR